MVETVTMPRAIVAAIFLRPAIAPLLVGAIAAALLVLAVLAYRRSEARGTARSMLLAMRVVAMLFISALLLGPSTIPPNSMADVRPKLTVLVDVSESMKTRDCAGSSRMHELLDHWLASAHLDALMSVADVELSLFGSGSEPIGRKAAAALTENAASSNETNLLDGISVALSVPRRDEAAGRRVLVLSDGRDTSGASAAPAIEMARARGVPIDTVCVGAGVLRRDLAVQAAPAQEFLHTGEDGAMVVGVHQTGLSAASVDITMSVDGPEGQVTTTHTVDVRGRTFGQVEIPIHHDLPGQYHYLVKVDAKPEELDTSNNSQTVFVDVSKARTRVLLLEGRPSWDMKFIAQALRKDPRLALTQVSRLSERRTEIIRTGHAATPDNENVDLLSPEGLARFDLFILGAGLERLISPEAAAALRDRVTEHGAGVVFARGRACEASADSIIAALSLLEPVQFASGTGPTQLPNARIALAPSAAGMSWLSSERLGVDLEDAADRLPNWTTVYRLSAAKPGTLVLARAAAAGSGAVAGDDEVNAIAIASMRVGRGQSLAILGEGMWRWGLVDENQLEFEGMYERCWQGIARWMSSGGDARPGQDITLQLSRQSAKVGEDIVAYVELDHRLESEPTEINVVRPDGRTEVLPLAHAGTAQGKPSDVRFEATFQAESAGVHLVRLDTPQLKPALQQRFLNAVDASLERVNLSADPLGMRALAEKTGGRVFTVGQAGEYPNYVRRHQFATIASEEATWAWNRWPFMAMLSVWLGLEWILRRRAGLP